MAKDKNWHYEEGVNGLTALRNDLVKSVQSAYGSNNFNVDDSFTKVIVFGEEFTLISAKHTMRLCTDLLCQIARINSVDFCLSYASALLNDTRMSLRCMKAIRSNNYLLGCAVRAKEFNKKRDWFGYDFEVLAEFCKGVGSKYMYQEQDNDIDVSHRASVLYSSFQDWLDSQKEGW